MHGWMVKGEEEPRGGREEGSAKESQAPASQTGQPRKGALWSQGKTLTAQRRSV